MNTKVRPCVYEPSVYNPTNLDFRTYRNNITEPVVQQDPEYAFEIERHFLYINSMMRDRSQYPDPANFRIHLQEPFRDVVSVELSSGVLPNLGNVSGDSYLILDIPELNHIIGADGSRYFGILGLLRHYNTSFFNLDKSNTNDMPVTFKPPKNKLDALTIILRHPDESMVSFGAENSTDPADLNIQTQFTIEVRTRVRKRVGLDRDPRAPIYPIV